MIPTAPADRRPLGGGPKLLPDQTRLDGVVPLRTCFVLLDMQTRHLLIRHPTALLVNAGKDLCSHPQASRRGGLPDSVQHDGHAGQRRAGPCLADLTEEAMLDGVPLRGTGRVVA